MIETILAPNPSPFTLDGTRTHIVDGQAIIDPGPAIESHIERIVAAAPRARWILITHRHADHASAAPIVAQRTGAQIAAPHGVFHPPLPDRELGDGDRFELSFIRLKTIATPGHTGESVSFISSEGDLFSGDTILGQGTTAIFPPDGTMKDYLESLRKLRLLGPGRLYPGHGPNRESAVAVIDEYIEHRHLREEQILDYISKGVTTLEGLRKRIYPELDPSLSRAAETQVAAHIDHMIERNIMIIKGDKFILRKNDH